MTDAYGQATDQAELFIVRRMGLLSGHRILAMGSGDRWINIAFSPAKIRKPGLVRDEIFFHMRRYFPDIQRAIPRRLLNAKAKRLRTKHG